MDAWYFQDALPLVGTYGDKISAAGAIAIGRKTIGISSGIGVRIKAALCHPAPLVLFVARRPLATPLAGDHKGLHTIPQMASPASTPPPSPLRILMGFSLD